MIRKSFFTLSMLVFLFLGTFAVYILLPYEWYLGYYPIGFIQIILLLISLLVFGLFVKNAQHSSIKQRVANILLMVGYTSFILGMLFSIFIWYAFMPG
ncbi:hypothetical protein [Jeotgalibaca ciconiae]|uniref:Uncharacterized protein n=1 Tax=Jeotgalibaca ciconiae TaxID=2496265 RepID=A0A3Q9BJY0_9LACT|nr:hypothetical protein [Jeotgalibaca ciconiae]AZP04137.1 hypothetical protein EJN90_05330 [Jeotgalibaca ciconiae]